MATKVRKGRKSTTVAGVKKTIVRGGKRYKHKSCYRTKAAAKAAAKKHRSKGSKKMARVVGKCVYTRG